MRRFVGWFLAALLALSALYLVLSVPVGPRAERVTYGVSFNTPYARELGLSWEETYDAILDDLGVRHLRLAAHWTMIEPQRDRFHWDELDYQVQTAASHDASVILAVGRRLPRWPECHVPDWAQGLSWDEQKEEIREQITAVVERYKDAPNLTYWQVENEPYLTVFAHEHCGDLDDAFLKEEITLVRELDPDHPVLVTDSGNLGLWYGAYRAGDAFGTSMYLYLWSPDIGPFKSNVPSSYYRVKRNVVRMLFGKKPVLLIELSAEPWLLSPITNASVEEQLARMDVTKLNESLNFALRAGFDTQYLWGAEWWYWLKLKGDGSMWERGKELFSL